jgi:hypothetical protein
MCRRGLSHNHSLCLEWCMPSSLQYNATESLRTTHCVLSDTVILQYKQRHQSIIRSSLLYSTITLEWMWSLSRMKNDRDIVSTLSSSSLSYTFTWVISRMCIEVPNLVIFNSNLRHLYMDTRLLWLLYNKGLLRLHILFLFCNWEMWSKLLICFLSIDQRDAYLFERRQHAFDMLQ